MHSYGRIWEQISTHEHLVCRMQLFSGQDVADLYSNRTFKFVNNLQKETDYARSFEKDCS